MNQVISYSVILYSLSKEVLLDTLTNIKAELHGYKNLAEVRYSIVSHPNFEQNYQKLVEHLFAVLQEKLAPACHEYNISEIGFFLPSTAFDNPSALCNHTQATFDVLMALVYMPLRHKYDDYAYNFECSRNGLEVAAHAYFWWEELDDDTTYAKIIKLFNLDFAE